MNLYQLHSKPTELDHHDAAHEQIPEIVWDKYKDNPSKFAGAAHNAISIMVDAIRRAGSSEPEKIREALQKTDYNGLVGNIKFTDKGQAYGQTVYAAQVKNNVPQVVKTATIAKP